MESFIIAVASLVILIIVIPSALLAARSFAPWVPSSIPLAREMLTSLPLTPGMRFCDLGCGDGRIVSLAAKEFGLAAYGCEISILPLMLAHIRRLLHPHLKISIEKRDLFTVDLKDYDIVYIYGRIEPPDSLLVKKIRTELRPGAFVISYNFSLPDLHQIREIHNRWRNVYLYQR